MVPHRSYHYQCHGDLVSPITWHPVVPNHQVIWYTNHQVIWYPGYQITGQCLCHYDSHSVLVATIHEVGGMTSVSGCTTCLYTFVIVPWASISCSGQYGYVKLEAHALLIHTISHSRYLPCFIILTVHSVFCANAFQNTVGLLQDTLTELEYAYMHVSIYTHVARQHECNKEKGKGNVQCIQSQVLLPSSIN